MSVHVHETNGKCESVVEFTKLGKSVGIFIVNHLIYIKLTPL